MPRKPEIGNIQLFPNRPLCASDKNGYVLKFYCPIRCQRIRRNCGTRDGREARRILRECRERLLNGEYMASDGAITAQHVGLSKAPVKAPVATASEDRGKTWDECYDRYRNQRTNRLREMSLTHALSRLQIAERIFVGYFQDRGAGEGLFIRDCATLELVEYLQERLLAGDEGRYDRRSPNTVNSILGAVMSFFRYCHAHEWLDRVPALQKFDVDDVMKGRPISQGEFDQLLKAVPKVVGEPVAESWRFTLQVLWESGFRIGDVMDFSWDDDRHLHPVWPTRDGEHPTLVVPSTQKNGEHQVIPMLPGLEAVLLSVPVHQRKGWVVNPRPIERESIERLTKERVSRLIARMGQAAELIVRPADERRGIRTKFASAHDLRRGCALRLINAGVSAETLMVVMRHADFATTQKFYGAMRSAQSAAAEVQEKMTAEMKNPPIVGGFMGGLEPSPKLSESEVMKLKALVASL